MVEIISLPEQVRMVKSPSSTDVQYCTGCPGMVVVVVVVVEGAVAHSYTTNSFLYIP